MREIAAGVSVQPADAQLTLSRGIEIANNERQVTVELRNDGNDTVSNVVVSEELESGHGYIWGSGQPVPAGSNPRVFRADQNRNRGVSLDYIQNDGPEALTDEPSHAIDS